MLAMPAVTFTLVPLAVLAISDPDCDACVGTVSFCRGTLAGLLASPLPNSVPRCAYGAVAIALMLAPSWWLPLLLPPSSAAVPLAALFPEVLYRQ
jgi:hypothetical protein